MLRFHPSAWRVVPRLSEYQSGRNRAGARKGDPQEGEGGLRKSPDCPAEVWSKRKVGSKLAVWRSSGGRVPTAPTNGGIARGGGVAWCGFLRALRDTSRWNG